LLQRASFLSGIASPSQRQEIRADGKNLQYAVAL
jgi:hypothetical protein